ncbi:hypothetical protein YSY43_15870 [Paenibacillus sp. YSY-4.3]
MEKIHFGVGSFHFYSVFEGDKTKIYNEYVDEVRRILNTCSNINNIIISDNQAFKGNNPTDRLYTSESAESDTHSNSYNRRNGVYPSPVFFRIEFDLFIPHRVQKDLLRKSPRTETEYFKVYMIYDNYFPVTIVELKEPKDTCLPSDGVRVVREFLTKELDKKSEILNFKYMGPSPFHVEFMMFYKFQEEEDFLIRLLKKEERGYDRYSFEINTNDESDYEANKRSIYLSIARELGFYYELEQVCNRRNFNWTKIEVLVDMLLESHNLHFWNINRYFKVRSILNELFYVISKFERDEIFFKQIFNRTMQEIYSSEEFVFFKELNTHQYDDFMDFPTEQVLRFVNTFEQRRLNLNEASSAIIGGIVGALLTIFFAK